jgi:hypothetical protein
MEIRRKVFSLLEDENGEERYYSTTEFALSSNEDYNEKIFSKDEKYSRMSRKDRRQLRKDLKKEGLTYQDRTDIISRSRQFKPNLERYIAAVEGDEDAREAGYKDLRKSGMTSGGVLGAYYGGALGNSIAGTSGAGIGAGLGAAAGVGIGYGASKLYENQARKHRDEKRYATEFAINADKDRVALGKMTPKEFKEKWGGGYWSKNPKNKKKD